MKKPRASFLSVLALSLLAACGGGADSAAVGHYQLDIEAMGAAEPEMKDAMKAIKGLSGSIDLRADHTGTFGMKMGLPGIPDVSETGTWKLDGETLTFTSKKDGKESPKSGTLKDGAITFSEDMGPKKVQMVFRKK